MRTNVPAVRLTVIIFLFTFFSSPAKSQSISTLDGKIEIGLASALPDFARGTHGNLAEQQRNVRPANSLVAAASTSTVAKASTVNATDVKSTTASTLELARKSNCLACHQVDKKSIGPSLQEIALKYKTDTNAESKLAEKVKNGGSGVWGAIPMPPNSLPIGDIRALVKWILAEAKEK